MIPTRYLEKSNLIEIIWDHSFVKFIPLKNDYHQNISPMRKEFLNHFNDKNGVTPGFASFNPLTD